MNNAGSQSAPVVSKGMLIDFDWRKGETYSCEVMRSHQDKGPRWKGWWQVKWECDETTNDVLLNDTSWTRGRWRAARPDALGAGAAAANPDAATAATQEAQGGALLKNAAKTHNEAAAAAGEPRKRNRAPESDESEFNADEASSDEDAADMEQGGSDAGMDEEDVEDAAPARKSTSRRGKWPDAAAQISFLTGFAAGKARNPMTFNTTQIAEILAAHQAAGDDWFPSTATMRRWLAEASQNSNGLAAHIRQLRGGGWVEGALASVVAGDEWRGYVVALRTQSGSGRWQCVIVESGTEHEFSQDQLELLEDAGVHWRHGRKLDQKKLEVEAKTIRLLGSPDPGWGVLAVRPLYSGNPFGGPVLALSEPRSLEVDFLVAQQRCLNVSRCSSELAEAGGSACVRRKMNLGGFPLNPLYKRYLPMEHWLELRTAEDIAKLNQHIDPEVRASPRPDLGEQAIHELNAQLHTIIKGVEKWTKRNGTQLLVYARACELNTQHESKNSAATFWGSRAFTAVSEMIKHRLAGSGCVFLFHLVAFRAGDCPKCIRKRRGMVGQSSVCSCVCVCM